MSDGVTHVPWEGLSRIPLTVDGARNILMYSRESAERLMGIHGQEEDIRWWAETHGYDIVEAFQDLKVHSLSPPEFRPGFSGVVQTLQTSNADAVAVRSLDRLGRDFQTQDDAMRRIWGAGATVISLLPEEEEWTPDRPGSPRWRLRRDYARMHEDQLYDLLAKLRAGRRRKMARGGYGGGYRIRRRYGVELVSIQGKLEYRPIPTEQAVIKRICELRASGQSYVAIAKTLNQERVPTTTGVSWSRHVVRTLALRGPDRLVALAENTLWQHHKASLQDDVTRVAYRSGSNVP